MSKALPHRIQRIEHAQRRDYALRLQCMSEAALEAELARYPHDPALTQFLETLSDRELLVLSRTGDVELVRLMRQARP